MSAATFTPGPWRLDDPSAGREHVLSEEYHSIDGGCGFYGSNSRERGFGLMGFISPADARLIAAAPDLLEVLQTIVRVADGRTVSGNLILDENSPLMDAARDVIAKALGSAA